MPHYHNHYQREEILKEKISKGYRFPEHEHKLVAFVNLAIAPYDWNQIYNSVRAKERITEKNWLALKGVILAMLVVTKRRNRESVKTTDAYIVDFIELIRSDKQGDPEKFLLNMRFYFARFLFVVGLQVAFGLDWREIVTNTLKLKNKPQPKTYGSLFANKYVRNLLYAYICWKNYRGADEDGYELGVNDVNTLLDEYSKRAHTISREVLQLLFVSLQENLPSYSYATRRQASYAIDNAMDGWQNLQYNFKEFNKKHKQAALRQQQEKEDDYYSKLSEDGIA
jgi:hypothetical protein